MNRTIRWHGIYLLALLPLVAAGGCWTSGGPDVVVYSALDQDFSEPILDDFQSETAIRARANFDIESTKTVGLVNRIIGERNQPLCDVFWNNEILHTLRLRRLGLLDSYPSPAADDFPHDYRSAGGYWYGFASRARVLIVNTEVLPDEGERPTSILDLADAKWRGRAAIAKPLFGTTASHAAVLFAHWGDERAKDYFRRVKANAHVLSGNKQVAQAVGRGQYAFGLTDTDDAIIERDNGQPIEIVFPDQSGDELGTLFIPNTVCIIKGGPNPEQARRLVDHLLRPEIEERLARGSSAQFPVNPQVTTQSRAQPDEPVRWMDVDFEAAAEHWDEAREFLIEEFATAQ